MGRWELSAQVSTHRTLAFSTEHQDFVNNCRVERPQHFGGSEPEPEVINISRCYSLMMSAGRAPNSSCAQEHSCFQSIDTRPWSLATFSNYLDDLGMLRPTLIKGKISVGILREWSGCTLEGVWTSASAGSSFGLSITPGAGTIFWHPNPQLGTHFDLFDANKDNLLTRDEFKKLGRFVHMPPLLVLMHSLSSTFYGQAILTLRIPTKMENSVFRS